MTLGKQPVSGSLEAKIIRACRIHTKCALNCPQRKVEDLGEIASFRARPSLFERAEQWLERITHRGGS